MLIWGVVVAGAVGVVIEAMLYSKGGRETGWSVVRRAGAFTAFIGSVTILLIRSVPIQQEYRFPVQVLTLVFVAAVSLLVSFAIYWIVRKLTPTSSQNTRGKQALSD